MAVILVDTGPLVALFDPTDGSYKTCVETLAAIKEPTATTVPVLTEAFHLLGPANIGAQRLIDFVTDGGLRILYLDDQALEHAFELMVQYADAPMDLADATLVALAERLDLRTVFTIDHIDFSVYRIKRRHQYATFQVIGQLSCATVSRILSRKAGCPAAMWYQFKMWQSCTRPERQTYWRTEWLPPDDQSRPFRDARSRRPPPDLRVEFRARAQSLAFV